MTKKKSPVEKVNANMPTNDMFRHLTLLLNIHKDNELLKSLFASEGIEVTNSKLQSWSIKRNTFNKKYRPMPTVALQAFIVALHKKETSKQSL